jgi:nucleoside-diphosphate-sugar epimerase
VTSGDPQSRDTILETLLAACGLRVTFPRLPTAPLLALAGLLERISEIFTLSHWEPPLTRYSVGALAFGQTLDISAARRDLGYAPTTKVLEALQSTGERWRAGSTPNAEAQL